MSKAASTTIERPILGGRYSTATLHNGVQMPLLGLGVFMTQDGEQTTNAVRWALRAGYRCIDTAAAYGNESSVNEGIRASGLRREEVFIVTKLSEASMRERSERDALKMSLARLGTDYVDLYVLEAPVEGEFARCYGVLEQMHRAGLIRAIGVCGFDRAQLEQLLQTAGVRPAVNIIERHPLRSQNELVDYCRQQGIQPVAHSPLCRGSRALLEHAALSRIAARCGKSCAQVALRWNLQQGVAVLPKSASRERIRENAALFDFALSEYEMALLGALDAQRGDTDAELEQILKA